MIPTRLICTVLEEMRTCIKTLNFSYLESLVEEAQLLANRMEAKLEDMADHERLQEDISVLKKQKDKLRSEIKQDGGKPVSDRW